MSTPESRARENIDRLLDAAGWRVQRRDEMNLGAARGVAVREFPLKTGYADYLLFVDRRAIGAVEAKAEGTPLAGVEAQSEKYSVGLPQAPALPVRKHRRRDLLHQRSRPKSAQPPRLCVSQARNAGSLGG